MYFTFYLKALRLDKFRFEGKFAFMAPLNLFKVHPKINRFVTHLFCTMYDTRL